MDSVTSGKPRSVGAGLVAPSAGPASYAVLRYRCPRGLPEKASVSCPVPLVFSREQGSNSLMSVIPIDRGTESDRCSTQEGFPYRFVNSVSKTE